MSFFPISPYDLPDLFWAMAGSVSAKNTHGQFPTEIAPLMASLRTPLQPMRLVFKDLNGDITALGQLEEHLRSDASWESVSTPHFKRSAAIYFACSAALEILENGFGKINPQRRSDHKLRLSALMDFITEGVRQLDEEKNDALLRAFEKCIPDRFQFTLKKPANLGFVAPQYNFDQFYLAEHMLQIGEALQRAIDAQMHLIGEAVFEVLSQRMTAEQLNETYNLINDALQQAAAKAKPLDDLSRVAGSVPRVSRHFRHRPLTASEIQSKAIAK